ncbi:DEKNAAC104755 [Brettanomyces naardenensis]|uniref:37S ribosomal protein S25, mitochondrial n=1 Tax=Brettanomyces naardenensis TaxID=13370 RepID=A0A448YRG2_BRENA|nr:DEKNAAC104755 [Brettanomyces naardenensis]
MNAIKSAGEVLGRTSEYLESGLVRKQPSWYKVLAYHPPVNNRTKTIRPHVLKKIKEEEVEALRRILSHHKGDLFYKTRLKPNQMVSNFLKPQKLHFIEDDLRDLFYRQHPWELADPKSLIENEHAVNLEVLDWSTMRQYTKKLDGESVVQRTLYLVNKEKKSLLDAYEQAKYEYYRLKIEDETETNVSEEQSEMFGAVYGKSLVEYGFDKEMTVLTKWKKDAVEQTRVIEAKRANSSAGGLARQENKDLEAEAEGEEETAEGEEEPTSEEDLLQELRNAEQRR